MNPCASVELVNDKHPTTSLATNHHYPNCRQQAQQYTHMLAILTPKRYHHPPAPTRLDRWSDGAEAFSAARTRGPYGCGTEKVVSSLSSVSTQCPTSELETHLSDSVRASHNGSSTLAPCFKSSSVELSRYPSPGTSRANVHGSFCRQHSLEHDKYVVIREDRGEGVVVVHGSCGEWCLKSISPRTSTGRARRVGICFRHHWNQTMHEDESCADMLCYAIYLCCCTCLLL